MDLLEASKAGRDLRAEELVRVFAGGGRVTKELETMGGALLQWEDLEELLACRDACLGPHILCMLSWSPSRGPMLQGRGESSAERGQCTDE